MKFKFLLLSILLSNIVYGQNFQMQYKKISANEIQFTTVYQGPSAEIILPAKGRIISLSEQNDLNAGGGRIRVGIRVGSDTNTSQEYTIRFTYSLITPNTGGLGIITDQWYPTLKEHTNVQYQVSTLESNPSMLVYPYTKSEKNIYYFSSSQNVKLATVSHTTEVYDTEIPITLFTTSKFQTDMDDVINIYKYISEYFGKKEIDRILIVNIPLTDAGSFISENQLVLTIPGVGNKEQIRNAMIGAWNNQKVNLSARLFNMFTDAVFRLAKINVSDLSSNEETGNTNSSIEEDLGKIVLVPNKEYYQNLFNTGFETNSVVNANIENMLNNYALLHMAQYNIGKETLLEGIKQYFNTDTSSDKTSSQTNTLEEATNTTETISEKKSDTEYVDWNTITQNKLSEPLFSLYTKEVLNEKALIPSLKANGMVVFRNSDNIPNLKIIDSSGNTIAVNWNNFKSININVSSNSTYTLDPEKQIPQKSYIESFYTFNTNEQITRNKVISIADRNKAPGEINIKKHLEIITFNPGNENTFNISGENKIYVVVTEILSNIRGTLKPAIKESFIAVDIDGKITFITNRLRI